MIIDLIFISITWCL